VRQAGRHYQSFTCLLQYVSLYPQLCSFRNTASFAPLTSFPSFLSFSFLGIKNQISTDERVFAEMTSGGQVTVTDSCRYRVEQPRLCHCHPLWACRKSLASCTALHKP
jgi:hypothetical protein